MDFSSSNKYSQNLDLDFKAEGGMITFVFFYGISKSISDISKVLLEVTRVSTESSSEWVYQSLCVSNKWDKALENLPCCLYKSFW